MGLSEHVLIVIFEAPLRALQASVNNFWTNLFVSDESNLCKSNQKHSRYTFNLKSTQFNSWICICEIKFQEFNFAYWIDTSSSTVEGLKRNQITELQLSEEIEPGDPETSHIMKKKKQEFMDRNK